MAAPVNPLPADSTLSMYRVTQTTHGFVVGQAIYHSPTAWVLAKSDNITTLATDIVAEVVSANVFRRAMDGERISGYTGLTAGAVVHCSAATAGAVTTSATQDGAAPGAVARNALGEAESATTVIYRSLPAEAI